MQIPLTQGKIAIVDDADYEWLIQYSWHVASNHNTWYARRGIGRPNKHTQIIRMHREIMNPPPGMMVDHVNHDGLDNRRSNLRNVTTTQNRHNGRKQSRNTSGYKGVCWDKYNSKWHVRIGHNGKTTFLGLFDCKVEAAYAYDEAAKILHGEFAFLNFPVK